MQALRVRAVMDRAGIIDKRQEDLKRKVIPQEETS